MVADPVDVRIKKARASFVDVYKELIKKGHFPPSYQNNLTFDASLARDPIADAQILLRLIYWLELNNDVASVMLLEKLNDVFCLELNSLISVMDLKKEPGPKILSHFQDLERYTAQINDHIYFPFRSALSKIALIIIYVNALNITYETRKETIQEMLGQIKADILKINSRLIAPIDENIIKDLLTLLGIHMVREPLVKRNTAKRYVIATILTGAIGYALVKILSLDDPDVRREYADRGWQTVSETTERFSNNILRHIGKGLSLGIAEGMGLDPRLNVLEEQVNRIVGVVERVQGETLPHVLAQTGRVVEVAEGLRADTVPHMLSQIDRVVATVEHVQADTIPQVLERVQGIQATVDTTVPLVVGSVDRAVDAVGAIAPALRDTLDTVRARTAEPGTTTHEVVRGGVTGVAAGILDLTGIPAACRWAVGSQRPAQSGEEE